MLRNGHIERRLLKALGLGVLSICFFISPLRQAHAQWDVYDVMPVPGDLINSIWVQLSGCPPVPGLGAMGVCLTPPIPGTLDADLVFGMNQISNAIGALNEGVGRSGQIGADATKVYHMQAQTAEDTGNAFISDHSVACALTMSHQARDVMNSFVKSFTARAFGMMTARGTGPQANETSIAAAGERNCEVADFICTNTNRLGQSLPGQFSSCPGAGSACGFNMGDADVMPTSLTEKYQLVLPQSVVVTQNDQHIQINANGDEEALAFKAAWKLCEHMLELLPPAPHTSGNLTSEITVAVDTNRFLSAVKMSGVRACAKALAYRTACPANAPSIPLGVSIQNLDPQGGAVTDCHTAQTAACHRLLAKPPNGIGIIDAGNDSNYALQNCDQNGLSAAMYDYIFTHRCMNGSYVSTTMPQIYGGHTARVEEELQKCLAEGTAFDAKWDHDNEDLVRVLSSVAERFGPGGGKVQNINDMPTQ